MDCKIRDGKYQWKFGQKPSFPMVPGVDCVGIVTSCGARAEKSGIVPGDRVASFLLHGCNAKYRLCTYTDLVRVPKETNPFEAVALIRTYTAAFQALMQGIHGHSRYSRKPLLHKRVLIVGPCGTFERALVELSIFLGARKVYFSAHSTSHSHDMYIRLLGAKPLSDDPEEWLDHIEGKIDIAVDSVCIDRYEHTFAALDEDGILVATGMTEIDKTDDFISNIEKMWTQTTIAVNNQCTFYNGFVHEWDSDRKQCMKDMIYLFNLLEKGKIKPKIATKIPMLKVAAAQERLDQNLESMERRGIIVVDPWLLPSVE
jgi:NADPH:quinone reductase-like Zn-dependent oxidoreductase